MSDAVTQLIDVGASLRASDVGAAVAPGAGAHARIHALTWSAADARLYIVVADALVFTTDDDGASWREVAEVNRVDGRLVASQMQRIDAVVDSVEGTVLLIGRDRRDGVERGVVWRKEAAAERFVRTVVTEPAWPSSKAGNATAGYFGAPPTPMIAVAMYASPAHFWYSVDDGVSWQRQDMAHAFVEHVHEVYLHRAANVHRHARLWVSGGDDPSGERSGVVTFDALDKGNVLSGFRYALRERPGYRLVGLAGDGKHVYIGNESLAGGMLRVLDNAQSIERCDFEYVLGKSRHDYHQFRSMVATVDGFLAAATDSYAFTGDTLRADSGGYLYLSDTGGAGFRELSLGMKWITGLAYDTRSFWIAGGMNREEGADPSSLRMVLLRVPKPAPFASLVSPYCAKPVIVDSSAFYEMAGYSSHPRPALAPGEATFRVDLSPYASIAVIGEAHGPATLVVEALPWQTWHPDHDAWREVATLSFASAGSAEAMLAAPATHNRWFRLRNAGHQPVELRHLAFVARR
ncbi:MAG TPA: hypothetical protein VFX05_05495 [Casimicrobiaceae bacterium]|nr:hypothetical protein [Casimicrobiaceae bacterium]